MKNAIKKAIAVLLVAVMVIGAAPLAGLVGLELPELYIFTTKAKAEETAISGTCGDNLTWTLNKSTGELVISGTGFMYGFSYLNAPWDCLSIKTVTISEGATRIGDYAFSGCVNLTDVYYTGTEKEWNTMSIGLDNETLTNATIHYNHTHNSESYVVYYDENGGENAPESQVKEAGTDLVLSSKMPCKSYVLSFNANGGNVAPTSIELDATFRGWCLAPNGNGVSYAPGSVYKENSTITLYAIWDYPEIGTLPVPERSGYTFIGWFTASGENPVEKGDLLMADVTLYAQWIVNEPNTPDDSPVPSEPVNRDVIIYPTQTTISYGDSIILHMDASKIPQGGKVEWYANNGNFSYSVIGNGYSCIITPDKSGDTTFTATIYDAKGNAVSTDEQTMTSKAGFFDKIIAFFKKLFGLTKTIPEAVKVIY